MKNNIKIGDFLEISIKNENKIIRTYKSRVEEIDSETGNIMIQIPTVQGQLVKLPSGDNYTILFFTENGLIRFDAKLVRYAKVDDTNVISMVLLDNGKKVQRRQYFRYDTEKTINVLKLDRATKIPNYNRIDVGFIKDIGGGGVRFLCNATFAVGDYLEIIMMLDETFFVITCKVLYVDRMENEKCRYQYRVVFESMLEGEREVIVQYIFDEQRKTLRKKKA